MGLGEMLPDLFEMTAMLAAYALAWFLGGASTMWLLWPWIHRKRGSHHRTHPDVPPRGARPVVSGGRHRSPPVRR